MDKMLNKEDAKCCDLELFRNALIEKGYEIIEDSWCKALSKDHRILLEINPIMKADNPNNVDEYEVRWALVSDFDRWANSGDERYFDTKREVLSFIHNQVDIVSEAISELIYEIVEEAFREERGGDKEKKKTILDKLEDMLIEYRDSL